MSRVMEVTRLSVGYVEPCFVMCVVRIELYVCDSAQHDSLIQKKIGPPEVTDKKHGCSINFQKGIQVISCA